MNIYIKLLIIGGILGVSLTLGIPYGDMVAKQQERNDSIMRVAWFGYNVQWTSYVSEIKWAWYGFLSENITTPWEKERAESAYRVARNFDIEKYFWQLFELYGQGLLSGLGAAKSIGDIYNHKITEDYLIEMNYTW